MSQTKRAWKLQEFVAHGNNVNCLAMGHKTARVMVTGGEDRRVNLWAAGKPNCILSLAGHTTPVEAVRFGYNEEMVVAGSMSGALKIWDLGEAKILRTLTGHKSGIRSLDFHPYGDYVASGSLDCNIKLWDIRRKGCIYTYKGHSQTVNNIKFSPDGRWLASAGGDGLIKIWDLTAGQLLTDMKLHTASVNVVEFHPNELLLASGSSDKTVKFWDLESFQLVCSTDQDSSPIRSIFFHPDGSCLYSGSKDFMKVYGWEPAVCYDSIPMGWAEVADMSVAGNQLIGASFSKTNVSTYVVDLKKIQPHGGVPHTVESSPKDVGGHAPLNSSHGRRSFLTDRPSTQSSRQSSVPKENLEEPQAPSPDQEDTESSADIKDPKDYREIFQPRSRLGRSPTRLLEPFQPPNDDAPVPEPEPVKQTVPAKKPTPTSSQVKTQKVVKPTRQDPPAQEKPPSAPSQPARQPAPSQPARQPAPSQPVRQHAPREPSPVKVNAEDFLPADAGPGGAGEPAKNMNEDGALDMISRGHKTMVTVLSNRSKCLQTVRAMWGSRNTKTAIDAAISMNDQSVIVDVLNVLNAKSGLWSLDIATCLLPQLKDLLASKYQDYVVIACDSLKIVLKNFGPVIKGNMTAPPSLGVDITREERYRKCNACYKVLMDIRSVVDRKSSLSGKVGDTFKQLQILLGTLD